MTDCPQCAELKDQLARAYRERDASIAEQSEECIKLRREIERLREALKPFARRIDEIKEIGMIAMDYTYTIAEYRAAHAALHPIEPANERGT